MGGWLFGGGLNDSSFSLSNSSSYVFVVSRFSIVYGVVGTYYCGYSSMICMIFLIDLGR